MSNLNIVFIVGSYYPFYSAVGKCVGNIADGMAKDHNVTVVCQKSRSEQNNVDTHNHHKIVRVETREGLIRNGLISKMQSQQGLNKQIYKLMLNAYRISRVIKTYLSPVTIRYELVDQYLNILVNLSEPIDLIIPASMPFEAVVAAVQYGQDRETKVMPYLFDQFVDSDTLHRHRFNKKLKRRNNLELERRVLSGASNVLAMHSLRDHFESELQNVENIFYVEHPLLLINENLRAVILDGDDSIQISYIGGLHKGYVTPEYLLELFANSNMENARLNFYITGNCTKIVNKYVKRLPQRIYNYGTVDKQTADQKLAQSDILISIGETKGVQLSSKIFDYMSNGKPIVHFYSANNDINVKVLQRYPLSLCLKQDYDELAENVILFDEFCKVHSGSNLLFEDIEEAFYEATPEYTIGVINSLMGAGHDL